VAPAQSEGEAAWEYYNERRTMNEYRRYHEINYSVQAVT